MFPPPSLPCIISQGHYPGHITWHLEHFPLSPYVITLLFMTFAQNMLPMAFNHPLAEGSREDVQYGRTTSPRKRAQHHSTTQAHEWHLNLKVTIQALKNGIWIHQSGWWERKGAGYGGEAKRRRGTVLCVCHGWSHWTTHLTSNDLHWCFNGRLSPLSQAIHWALD